ncbi:heat-inducible transcription repressor HrcA [Ammonifex degensii KC4]|uniref:Heat-inducible transcription repressor HrcA n=1 Tax=Ammonifex degensii (strain DSM 10501 / KC4) TaxID=429009 RepID=C9RBX5_AMMDK|nr:heat-inducible transcription repressor HrcA [Ammonifex degensii KC4]
MLLDERKARILAAVVEDFISTGEPVGSRTIARKYGLGVSPATIRNEMADLEEMGYLEQPHTSAGRIPSELGYRYYVDYLMEPQEPTDEEKELIRAHIKHKAKELATVIQRTGQILAELTHCATLATVPRGSDVFRHLQLIPFGRGKAMVLVVLASGEVVHQFISVPGGITAYDLETITEVLNAKLRGVSVADIKATLLREIRRELARYRRFLDMVLELLREATETKGDRIFRGGLPQILFQPEFHNVERLRTLLGLLEQEDYLCDLLSPQSSPSEGVCIRIGSEVNRTGKFAFSLVSVRYRLPYDLEGVLAVLGPTRMPYARIAGLLSWVANSLNEELKQIFG